METVKRFVNSNIQHEEMVVDFWVSAAQRPTDLRENCHTQSFWRYVYR